MRMSQRTRILLIDDDNDFREAIRTRLAVQGFEVTAVGSGQEGLQAIAAQAFDLILLDMLMPGKGGIATYQEIRLSPQGKEIPVILVTAIANQEHWEPMPNATDGRTFIMGKPYEYQILLTRIRQMLGGPLETG